MEEGEIIENEQGKHKPVSQGHEEKPATPKKNVRRSTGEELEDGELVSSDEETQPLPPVVTKKSEKKPPQSNHINAVPNNKEKRGMENKENRADKKKKGVC